MALQIIIAAVGALVIVSAGGGWALRIVFLRIAKMSKRQGQIEFLALETWNAVMRRALAEGVIKGTITMPPASPRRLVPFDVSPEARDWLAQLAPDLQDIYDREWRELDDNALALAIEARFGDRIVQEVCIPNKISHFQCLLIACAVARETQLLPH
jgi:hypothetical protein